MTDSEILIRKQWLATLIVSFGMTLCVLPFHLLNNPGFAQFGSWVPPSILAFNILVMLLFVYFSYWCIYRKPGTKLLMVFLILTPISFLATIGGYISGKVPLPANGWLLAHSIVGMGLTIWWYTLHLKMRKINKKLKAAAG